MTQSNLKLGPTLRVFIIFCMNILYNRHNKIAQLKAVLLKIENFHKAETSDLQNNGLLCNLYIDFYMWLLLMLLEWICQHLKTEILKIKTSKKSNPDLPVLFLLFKPIKPI